MDFLLPWVSVMVLLELELMRPSLGERLPESSDVVKGNSTTEHPY